MLEKQLKWSINETRGVGMLLTLSKIFYFLAGVLCLCEVFLLFKFRAWKLIGDLLGINQKRAIQEMLEKGKNYKYDGKNMFSLESKEEVMTEYLERIETTEYLACGGDE